VELLLAYKANVNSRDKAGRTPLYVAKAAGYKDIEVLLRQHGGHE
jgi:ankyrin repeat protein